ncbi:hypothetical protein [Alkaliphilus peptidifermentans]|uniref:Uncharacterized protein n=1 Tax=Alkaliphilus peptidifermentans DSM 18978 TaxID=1120976 RepID=A0A1G5L6P9_9FIRM|nr:hypothetical protein [Alkaliphilus peptidifermentans]SCZ08486.1 hypothetical protein SAMN03080606_04123 [Alkaliphilus peptidifermentans DSM 18978]
MISKKRLKFAYYFVLYLTLFFVYQTDVAYANSSWIWLTSSPKKLLPIAIVFTLVIEYLGIVTFGKLKQMDWKRIKVLGIVIAANVASFVVPYIMRTFMMKATASNWVDAWKSAFNAGPYYIVLFGYLFITILVEIPLVFGILKKHTLSNKFLFGLIITLNVITTSIVAILERILYKGQW